MSNRTIPVSQRLERLFYYVTKFMIITRLGVDKVKPKVWFHHVLFAMGDLHLVLPALNMSTLDAGILIMVQQVRLMLFSLNMVDYSMSFLLLSTFIFYQKSRGDHYE